MAILTKGNTYSSGQSVTAANLNALVDSATFTTGNGEAVDGSTLQVHASGYLMVKDGGITSTKLAPGAVNASAIGSGAITSTQLASNSVTSSQIASSAVTSAELADNAVITARIADDAVTSAKISSTDTTLNVNDTHSTVGIGALATSSEKLLISSNDAFATVATIENTNTGSSPLAVLKITARGNATIQLNDTNPTPGSQGIYNVESGNGNFQIVEAATAGQEHFMIKPGGTINMKNLPTSPGGLAAGDVWNNSGVLNIIP